MKCNKKRDFIVTEETIITDIQKEAKILGKSEKSSQVIAKKAAVEIMNWVNKRQEITEKDLNKKAASVLKNLDPDISYIYQNRGKII